MHSCTLIVTFVLTLGRRPLCQFPDWGSPELLPDRRCLESETENGNKEPGLFGGWFALVAVLLLALCQSCSYASPESMTPPADPSVRGKHPETIAVSVRGAAASTSWSAARISDESLADALRAALKQSGVFAAVSQAPADVVLEVFVYGAAAAQELQPRWLIQSRWRLVDTATRSVIGRGLVSSEGSAGFGSVRKAQRAAGRENVQGIIKDIASIPRPAFTRARGRSKDHVASYAVRTTTLDDFLADGWSIEDACAGGLGFIDAEYDGPNATITLGSLTDAPLLCTDDLDKVEAPLALEELIRVGHRGLPAYARIPLDGYAFEQIVSLSPITIRNLGTPIGVLVASKVLPPNESVSFASIDLLQQAMKKADVLIAGSLSMDLSEWLSAGAFMQAEGNIRIHRTPKKTWFSGGEHLQIDRVVGIGKPIGRHPDVRWVEARPTGTGIDTLLKQGSWTGSAPKCTVLFINRVLEQATCG